MSRVRHLLIRAGDRLCALPLERVRRVVRALPIHPLPGARPELLGLAEFAGEPLAVLDLARLIGATPGARAPFPVTVVAWAGATDVREGVGFAADEAVEVIEIETESIAPLAPSGASLAVGGEALSEGRPVRLLDLVALGGGG